jgi:hypothetical protein
MQSSACALRFRRAFQQTFSAPKIFLSKAFSIFESDMPTSVTRQFHVLLNTTADYANTDNKTIMLPLLKFASDKNEQRGSIRLLCRTAIMSNAYDVRAGGIGGFQEA